jgi:hypothetical protein
MARQTIMRSLRSRLQKLEDALKPDEGISLRIGLLHQLPADYTGEKHVVIVRYGEVQGGRQDCSFEERPGPVAPGPPDPVPRLCLTETQLRIIGDPVKD